ncbi:MAG: hypothetical protein ACXADB_09945 [Candidatus Hermodarchaeia archaeon]|jgi:hypothetical protein
MVKYRVWTTIWNRKVTVGEVVLDNVAAQAEDGDLVVPCELLVSPELATMLEELFWSYVYTEKADIQTYESV